MFCIICGKETKNTDGICDDCRAGATAREPLYTSRYGFGAALTSIVVGGVSACLTCIGLGMVAYILVAIGVEQWFGIIPYIINAIGGEEALQNFDPAYLSLFKAGSAMSIVGGIACVFSLVFGIIAIKRFGKAKANGTKPTATLVLGIIGVVLAAWGLLVTFMNALCYVSIAGML